MLALFEYLNFNSTRYVLFFAVLSHDYLTQSSWTSS